MSGVSHPTFVYIWSEELKLAMDNKDNLSAHLPEFRQYLYYFLILAGFMLLINWLIFTIWKIISRSISNKIRVKYLEHFIKTPLTEI